jgi:hypothetical protein
MRACTLPAVLLFVACLGLAWLGLASQARADIAYPAWGGSGDHTWQVRCPKRTYLVGFHGRTGLWIDRIALVCAPIRPGVGWSKGETVQTKGRGGFGGHWADMACNTDAVVVGASTKLTRSNQLARIVFTCRSLVTGAKRERIFGGTYLGAIDREYQGCPADDYAAGAEIRSGVHVAAFGMFCRDYKPPKVAQQGTGAPSQFVSPQAPAPAQQQAAAKAVPFAGLGGTWDMTTSEGVHYTLILTVEGSTISGYFGATSPGLEGTLSGPIDVGGLKFGYHYEQPKAGASGQGILVMSADGNSLGGDFVPDQDTTKRLHWQGTRRP